MARLSEVNPILMDAADGPPLRLEILQMLRQRITKAIIQAQKQRRILEDASSAIATRFVGRVDCAQEDLVHQGGQVAG